MELVDINEFRTTWNNEKFFKTKSARRAAKHIIKKSIIIAQLKLLRQLKYIENNLQLDLKKGEDDRQLLNNHRHANLLAENLQQRLKLLKDEIDNYNLHIKKVINQEKEYWKELEQTIAKRTNMHKTTTNQLKPSENTSNARPIAVVNTTFVMHVEKNNENLPPLEHSSCELENKSPVKVPKIRRKKKVAS